ncbi:uncharacterized protein LOC113503579 [Trichoplusia ni]|uniref:Uncharacterized protein LOC113503579 n=1 Tax=Trichoplusia ni TaxID=7111 RepID=A0A7E5WL58_TRINI|nr:uncharacterized protein LOC113503579 [Trichoplusia ni]
MYLFYHQQTTCNLHICKHNNVGIFIIAVMNYPSFYFLTLMALVQSPSAPTHLLVTRAGPCSNSGKTTITVSELSLTMRTYDSLVSGVMNISEDLDNGWYIKATMQKCVDIRNIDTCDFFKSFSVVKSGCVDEDEMENVYSLLFHYSEPRLECPLQAGEYNILNYPLFTEDNYLAVYESKISTSVFGYTLRLDGFSEDHRKILCIEAYLQLVYMRIHEWVQTEDAPETTLGPNKEEEQSEEELI